MTGGEKLQGAFSVGLIELKASHVWLLRAERGDGQLGWMERFHRWGIHSISDNLFIRRWHPDGIQILSLIDMICYDFIICSLEW